MTVVQRAQFQQAAVEHITECLLDRRGSRRFLLADEVGLGKTIVARGVIEELAKKKSPLRVVYLCSNAEIADQNRLKLDPNAQHPVGRVTELAVNRVTAGGDVLLYSFTPGTSLREGTGLAWERRLLLYLVHRIYGEDVWRPRWREYFRCSVNPDRWQQDTRWSALQPEFDRKTSVQFQDELRSAWRGGAGEGPSGLRALQEGVEAFDSGDPDQRSRRNRLIAQLRGTMQRVALRTLDPDLVILDEVQRFRDVIDEAGDGTHLASELFKRDAPVLILSATPYRLLTLDHEVGENGSSHHEDFFRTLAFLCGQDRETPARVRRNLEEFGRRLRDAAVIHARDQDLIKVKRALEEDLRRVVCRTERNWYVLDVRRGVDERGGDSRELPTRGEVEEYLRIQRGLGAHLEGSGQVTEFWKSSPSLLTFLDASYALLRRLRDKHIEVPRALVTPGHEIHDLADRNQRVRYVIDHVLGTNGEAPQLWTAPTYTYHRDHFFGDAPRRKLLVFSGWRFVPKAVSVIASVVATHRLGGEPDDKLQPLKFSDRRSFHVFDVCFPSLALATLVNPRLPRPDLVPGEMSAEDVLNAAADLLRERLKHAGVRVSPTGTHPLWRAIARVERREGNARLVEDMLAAWDSDDEEEPADAVLSHRDWIVDWLRDDRGEIEISEARLRHMALIAAFSPAVSLLRSLRSVYAAQEVTEALPELHRLCFGAMRRYFNRPIVQQAIRGHVPRTQWAPARAGAEHGYAERTLLYAGDAHLQAVLDEHVYLMRHAGQRETAEKAIEHFDEIWTLSRGSRRTNGRRGSGELVRVDTDAHSHATHFALAFGDDVSRDSGPGEDDGERLRKSIVREAFNSPFWPFVLATTSVGQEGLDFHLYCRDILHWNLPSNPVDLEQREGRINRRDCLAVRESIARDWPIAGLADALRMPNVNPWTVVFERLAAHDDEQRYKHGLYPHWIYECRNPEATVRIQRHVAFFATSRDVQKYARLKTGLALYRLVFGQANQEDLLNDLKKRLDQLSPENRERSMRRLAGYMLSLSPIGANQARKIAEVEAGEILARPDPASLDALLADVVRLRAQHHDALGGVARELDALTERVRAAGAAGDRRSRDLRVAVAALVYLRHPYDHIFDLRVEGGFDDDIEVIREAARSITAQ